MRLSVIILVLALVISCQTKDQSRKHPTQVANKENVTSDDKIIKAVKNHSISDSFTAGQVIDSLSNGNSITTWQLARFEEYKNNNDIIGVIGETSYQSFGGGIKFKIAYIYQISTGKINFYTGFRNENQISEIDFIVSYHETKMFEQLN